MKRTRLEIHLILQRITLFTFLGLILLSLLGAYRSPVAAALNRGERVSLVLFGIDASDLSQHTDTLMVGVFDPLVNYLSVLSIPRDTRIDLPGYRFNRVNEIYGYQYRKTKDRHQAALLVQQGVEHLLSSPEIRVSLPYFLQIDFSGFQKMIDLLGGVWVTIKIPMHYDDYAGNYHFHKEPGRYLLKGNEALHYVRFRGQTGDRGRIFRQHEFLRNTLKRLANPMMVVRVPKMAAVVETSVISNLSLWDTIYLGAAVRRLRGPDVGFYVLPGQPKGAYWAPKKDMVHDLAAMLVYGREFAALEEAETIQPQADRITVNVWNASGKKGFAYKVTRMLRSKGYDVVDWGNYAAEQLQTRVIDRRGRISSAQSVAGALGVDSFHSEPNSNVLVDVEVVIGQNYISSPLEQR